MPVSSSFVRVRSSSRWMMLNPGRHLHPWRFGLMVWFVMSGLFFAVALVFPTRHYPFTWPAVSSVLAAISLYTTSRATRPG